MVNVDLFMTDGSSSLFLFHRFIAPRVSYEKKNGIQAMPLPATGDPPMLMNMSGMSAGINVSFKIMDRNDYCGLGENLNTSDLTDNTYTITMEDGSHFDLTVNDNDDLESVTYTFSEDIYTVSEVRNGIKEYFGITNCSDENCSMPNSLTQTYDVNTMYGQFAYLRRWLVSGMLGVNYILMIYEKDGSDFVFRHIFQGIPSDLTFNWVGGNTVIDASFKFTIGMVIA